MIKKIKSKLFFETKTIRGTILKNFLWLGTSQVGSRLIKSAITIYAARALGTAGYGVFSYAMALTGFFIFFKNIGVDSILTREVARRPAEREQLFATSFWLEIGLLAVTAFLLFFIAPLFNRIPEALILIPVLAVMLIADDLKDLFVAFFRGIEKMEWEAIVVVATNIAIVIFGFVALLISASPLYLALAYAAAAVFGAFLAGGIIFFRHTKGFFRSFDRNLIAPILRSAWPIAFGGLASIFLFNIDIVMLGFWRTVDDVGIYAAVQKIVGILTVIPTLVGASTFPMFSRLAHVKDSARVRQVMESLIGALFLFAAPLVLGGTVLGASLLKFIFGSAYGAGANAMAVLLFSIFPIFLMVIFANFIFAYDEQRKTIGYPIIASLVNVGLNFLLVPRLGMIGASLATVASSMIYAFLMFRFCRKIEEFSLWRGFQKVLVAAIIMTIFTWSIQLLNLHVILNIILSAALYFFILKLLKEKMLEEILAIVKK
ncbi:MAG: flippase [Patescibacteria group bacterium]